MMAGKILIKVKKNNTKIRNKINGSGSDKVKQRQVQIINYIMWKEGGKAGGVQRKHYKTKILAPLNLQLNTRQKMNFLAFFFFF